MNFVFQKKIKWKSVLAAKETVFGRNTETAGQNYFFVNDKNSWNSAKTAPFSAYEFFIPEKIKWKLTKKAVFQGTNTETAVQKTFLGDDTNSWNSAKTALFSAYEFFIQKRGTIKTHKILRKQHLPPFLGYVLYIFPTLIS